MFIYSGSVRPPLEHLVELPSMTVYKFCSLGCLCLGKLARDLLVCTSVKQPTSELMASVLGRQAEYFNQGTSSSTMFKARQSRAAAVRDVQWRKLTTTGVCRLGWGELLHSTCGLSSAQGSKAWDSGEEGKRGESGRECARLI